MTDNILDICDVRHTHVNLCVYVSHIGSSTICCWPVMHRTMWAPVHIVAYSFLCPSDHPCRTLNQIPRLLTACSAPSTYSPTHAQCRLDVGRQYILLKHTGPPLALSRVLPIHRLGLTRGEILLNTHPNHTETARGGGVSHDGKITNLQQRQQCLVFRSKSSCEWLDSRKALYYKQPDGEAKRVKQTVC